MEFFINFKRLAYYLMPPSKRRKRSDGSFTLRLKWWQYLAGGLDVVFSQFHLLRLEARIKSNVSSQVMSLEWYLKRQIHPDIYISMPDDGGVFVSRSADAVLLPLVAGLSNIPETGVFVATTSDSDDDFIVHIPDSADTEKVERIVTIYKFLSIKHKIEII